MATEAEHGLDPSAWDAVMLPSQRERLLLYIKKYRLYEIDPKTGLVRHAIVCLNHNPEARARVCMNPSRIGSTLFNLTHHGFLFNTMLNRPLLTLEWAFAHHMINSLHPGMAQNDTIDLRRIMGQGVVSRTHIRSLVGLGWHEGIMGSWLMFLLASVELKSMFTQMPNEIQVPIRITTDIRRKRRRLLQEQRLGIISDFGLTWAEELIPIVVDQEEPTLEEILRAPE